MTISAAKPLPPSPAPPRWALGAALVLGALAALLPSTGHVHSGGQGSWAHQHFFAGAHSHEGTAVELPAGDRHASRPSDGRPADGQSTDGQPADGGQDSQVVALALALSLDALAPALRPAAALPFEPLVDPPPALPRASVLASPFSPRGPPALPC